MKKYLLWLVLALAISAQGAAFDQSTAVRTELKPAQQEAQAARLAAEVLARYHYKATPLDQTLSAKIYDQYLKSLDAEKLFFVQPDIERLSAYRTGLGDAILRQDLTVPFAIFNLYEKRVLQRFAYARTLLEKGFDFQTDESYQLSREKEPWPQTEADMRELWRKRVKNDWLRLKLAGKSDKEIATLLDRRYENFQKRVARVKSTDAFQTFMNAYTTAIEPHTNYMGPRAAEDFDISMRLSLVGIGAVLMEINEYVTIRELVPGSPAAASGELKIGDRILGVAQGPAGPLVDVQGWRMDDTVALIRGAPDSVVVLDVLPAESGSDGKHKRVTLVRKTISLAEQAAKAAVRSVSDGKITRRIGVLTLPSFYEDFAARQNKVRDYKSATRDVAVLLEGFRKQKVDGVLIDLRNNGGGSLNEAISLTGLFIDKGPIVQQRNAAGAISVGSDTLAGAAWDGPLAVLINGGSASASEIFAAAIQDYGRGLIIGEPSFGKGTVQSMIDLDQIAKNEKPRFGELKLTIAQFFRINGGTTQLRGVTPDILFPSATDEASFRESSFDNALPWTQVEPASYAPAGDLKEVVPVLRSRHAARVKNDKDFQYLQEDIAEATRRRTTNRVSLNEAARRTEQNAEEARLAARESAKEPGNAGSAAGAAAGSGERRSSRFRDDGLQADERNLATELAAEKARKDAKDALLNEAVQILSDQVAVAAPGVRVADRIKSGAMALPQ
jgi:carboxyl-terminal processing protease